MIVFCFYCMQALLKLIAVLRDAVGDLICASCSPFIPKSADLGGVVETIMSWKYSSRLWLRNHFKQQCYLKLRFGSCLYF